MKIVAINGSHRKGRNTADLLKVVLEEAATLGASTELLELKDLNIKLCTACSKCMRKPECSIMNDDMGFVAEKLLEADGILIGSPVYWYNVTTLMKNFMDRTRYLHMTQNLLANKVGGAVTIAGLRYGGQDVALRIMEFFLQAHGLHLVDSRHPESLIRSHGVSGTLMEDFKDGKPIWRNSIHEDELIVASCKQLGRNMVKLVELLHK